MYFDNRLLTSSSNPFRPKRAESKRSKPCIGTEPLRTSGEALRSFVAQRYAGFPSVLLFWDACRLVSGLLLGCASTNFRRQPTQERSANPALFELRLARAAERCCRPSLCRFYGLRWAPPGCKESALLIPKPPCTNTWVWYAADACNCPLPCLLRHLGTWRCEVSST